MKWQVLEVTVRHGFVDRCKSIGQVEADTQPKAIQKAVKTLCDGDWSRGPNLSVHPAKSPLAQFKPRKYAARS